MCQVLSIIYDATMLKIIYSYISNLAPCPLCSLKCSLVILSMDACLLDRDYKRVLNLSLICCWLFLPVLPKSIGCPLFIFYSHIITYYSHIILYALLFQVLISRETWIWNIFYCGYCVDVSDEYSYIHTNKIVMKVILTCPYNVSSLMLLI